MIAVGIGQNMGGQLLAIIVSWFRANGSVFSGKFLKKLVIPQIYTGKISCADKVIE